MPTVSGRDSLWHDGPDQPVVVGLSSEKRQVLVTHVLDAEPDHKTESPESSAWPFLSAIALSGLFIGSIFTPWAVVIGALPTFIAMVAWFWPRKGQSVEEFEHMLAAGMATPEEQTH
jgi:cytochrome c oxidase subunit 1